MARRRKKTSKEEVQQTIEEVSETTYYGGPRGGSMKDASTLKWFFRCVNCKEIFQITTGGNYCDKCKESGSSEPAKQRRKYIRRKH